MATIRSLSVRDIMRMRPCEGYMLGRLKALWAGRATLTPLEILDLDISGKNNETK